MIKPIDVHTINVKGHSAAVVTVYTETEIEPNLYLDGFLILLHPEDCPESDPEQQFLDQFRTCGYARGGLARDSWSGLFVIDPDPHCWVGLFPAPAVLGETLAQFGSVYLIQSDDQGGLVTAPSESEPYYIYYSYPLEAAEPVPVKVPNRAPFSDWLVHLCQA